MGTGKDPRMREALRLARVGDKEQARQLLVEILRQNRDNFDAWTVMAQVAESHNEAVTCMKQALRLRPDDERAQRYLDYLLHGDQQAAPPSTGMLKTSHWLLAGLGAAAIVCLAAVLIFFLPRLGSQEQANQPGEMSGSQLVANQPIDCTTLINDALEVSDQGCDQVDRDQVCYGHNTVQAQLASGSNARFDTPGNTIPINILERFVASPLDLQKGEWGVGVFRLEANLPGTLPGQLVTLLIFGNTSIQNTSGDMHAFYFTSGLGGIRCDAVPFDGILVNMADGDGFAFKANGTDITLQGNSILRAIANDSLVITTLSGTGIVSAFGLQQLLRAGQTVMVPLGGSSGLEADGPPGLPRPADRQTVNTGCTLTGQGCPGGSEVAEQAATTTSVPIDPSIPTNTPVPVAPGQPTNTPVPLATNTPVPVSTAAGTVVGSVAATTREPDATGAPQATAALKTPTSNPVVTATTPPPTTPPPTTPPPTTPPPTAPPPTTPPPTTPPPTTPPPTTPPPTTPPPNVCSTISLGWGGTSNRKVTITITSGGATILETVDNVTWPGENGDLKKINEINVGIFPMIISMPVSGSAELILMFEETAADTGYKLTLTFSGECTKDFERLPA